MKIEHLAEVIKLNSHLASLRSALDGLPNVGTMRLQYDDGPTLRSFTMSADLLRQVLKDDIGSTKEELRGMGVEFKEDKE